MRRFSDEVKHFDRKMKIAAIPCPATRNRTPAIFRPSFRRSHVRRGNLMPSGGRNRRRPYASEIKDSPVYRTGRRVFDASGFTARSSLRRRELRGLAGCAAYGCKPRLLANMNVPGASAPGTLENMGSLIVLPSARPSGFSVFPGARNGPGAPDTCRILETVPAASVRIRW